MRTSPSAAHSSGSGQNLAVLAAGVAAGLAAVGAVAVLRGLLRHPAVGTAVHGPGRGGREEVTAVKDSGDPPADRAGGLPVVQGGPGAAVEVTSLDAAVGSPPRTWVVSAGSEWNGLPEERVIPPAAPRRGDGASGV